MTFTPHPRAFFAQRGKRPELVPNQISSLRDKLSLLTQHGMQQIVLLRFNQALADMQAEEFVHRLLIEGLNTRWLLVGRDFRFGHKRSGDIDLLETMGPELGFSVTTLEDISDASGQRISSSALRTALAVGDLKQSENLLGRPYRLSGHVLHGQKLGQTLGFPTLNLRVPQPCAARSGIYVVRVLGLGQTAVPGVASLGVRPTVCDDGHLLLETHILAAPDSFCNGPANPAAEVQAAAASAQERPSPVPESDAALLPDSPVLGDCYGTLICIEFLKFLREEETFPDLSTLTAAIHQDALQARQFFAAHPWTIKTP